MSIFFYPFIFLFISCRLLDMLHNTFNIAHVITDDINRTIDAVISSMPIS